MALINDYFLLYHGIHFKELKDQNIKVSNGDEEQIKLFSLLLMISRKKFDKFYALEHFKLLCESIYETSVKDLDQLHSLQYSIIKELLRENSSKNFQLLQDNFNYLNSENILCDENYKKLISLFKYKEIKEKKHSIVETNFSFIDEKNRVFKNIELLEDFISKESLGEVKTFIEEQKFSVGITGVMNAGKSTMVNALMGESVLGTSVVPETANLTILQYSKESQARVFYWNSHEWDNIVKSADKLDSMKDFVLETNSAFENNLKEYVQEDSRVDEIDVNKLSEYTSAEHSEKRCNLVKYVELKTDLAYLKDGVEIVDTPGLDDPVIQREEITKEYIGRCDMLLHLMNVSQSATQKDVEFIIDALLYQNISKLLIVITRSDTVSKKELDEVIAYTKHSIQNELKVQNKSNKLDYILDTISFIPISGQMGLLCKTDESKAKSLGYTLENTGITELETYLDDNLFGPTSEKSLLLIHSANSKLLNYIENQVSVYEYELELFSKSEDELKEKIENFKVEKSAIEKKIVTINEDIAFIKENTNAHIVFLEHFLMSEFYALQTVVRERVVSDVRYSFEKSKKIPEASRTKVIIQTAIKDGIIDIVRDYKYKLSKKLEEIYEQVEEKYRNFSFKVDEHFNVKEFFSTAFDSGFLTHNNEVLIQGILEAVKNSKAKDITALNNNINNIIKDEFAVIEKDITSKLNSITTNFIEEFLLLLNRPNVMMKDKIEFEEKTLESHLHKDKNMQNDSAIEIHKKLTKLLEIQDDIKGLKYV